MRAKAIAVAEQNHYLQERFLREMLYMMKAFIKKTDFDSMIDELNKARNYIKKQDARFVPYVDKYLDEVNSTIYDKAAHVLLPVSVELEEEFDMERFLKESDL